MGKLQELYPENSPVAAAHPEDHQEDGHRPQKLKYLGLVAIAEQNQASALLVRLAGCGDHSVLDHDEFVRRWLHLQASER